MRNNFSEAGRHFRINIFIVILLMVIEWYVITHFFSNVNCEVTADYFQPAETKCVESTSSTTIIKEVVPTPAPSVSNDVVNLQIPYINEAPENQWVGSWKNACEEAVITMMEQYYTKKTTLTIAEGERFMQILFDAQKSAYGSDANSDTIRTLFLIDNYSSFGATLKTNPTLDGIKQELLAGRPVMAFHYGFDLRNHNIPFLATGSSYHTTLIKGFDDANQQFITHDPGDEIDGPDHRYGYEIFMNSLRDYNYSNSKADGWFAQCFIYLRKIIKKIIFVYFTNSCYNYRN
ncbi:MAG: hypothetical protein A2538_04295 [Candidatus Magasanikbacteria bacterium RIFOXYD2_FULL_41_14]|uniref:Peptidase C39-like domain-containing protein n=1 Tax=Candidatus Magasanikbacteria bacterium RIFOXYD2_FULL_41_14 TaxID=1798709 RepID=A0A1F6PEM6_9BACT|nr:MAG: hypothetical protein A2538_04295 [Candidatus Magasanikbacteria bacterium RIFOXYD2_FULL_41_14]